MSKSNEGLKKYYDDETVKWFVWATMGWGFVALLVGLLAALQLAYWKFNGVKNMKHSHCDYS